MHTWPVQDAQARFNDLLQACLDEGPQIVTQKGAQAAVLVPIGQWQHLQASARPTLKQLLLSDQARADMVLPSRGWARRRAVLDQV